jgi:acylphosphatase
MGVSKGSVMPKQIRTSVVITGKVQGVNFRAETRRAARQRNVRGWVRNRSDGSVEALFEGDEPDVKAMLEWCRQGSSFSRVQHVDIHWETYNGEFDRFEIVF